jgi:DNA-directed RNA polymerase subunit F
LADEDVEFLEQVKDDNMQINKLIEQFQEYLKLSAELRPDYIASLGKGDNEAKITSVFPETPALLKAIYNTVSGTSSEEEEPSLIEFIPGYRLIHINEYEAEMKILAGILEEKGHQVDGVILPILTNYGSDFICYYKSADGVERVCDLLHDFGDLIVMYESPEKFLETLCEFYKQEVYFLDEEGYLDCDLVKEGEVGAALNPDAKYWSE